LSREVAALRVKAVFAFKIANQGSPVGVNAGSRKAKISRANFV
jgi:hypothetical protein